MPHQKLSQANGRFQTEYWVESRCCLIFAYATSTCACFWLPSRLLTTFRMRKLCHYGEPYYPGDSRVDILKECQEVPSSSAKTGLNNRFDVKHLSLSKHTMYKSIILLTQSYLGTASGGVIYPPLSEIGVELQQRASVLSALVFSLFPLLH